MIDRPVCWDEVIFKCIPLQEGEEDANEVGLRSSVILGLPVLGY